MDKNARLSFSYEFFPPRTAVMERRLWRTAGQLERLRPEFYSMTYGALGSAQQISIDSAIAMHRESPIPVAAHLTCADATRAQVLDVAHRFHAAGIRRIVALRGDAAETGGAPAYAFPSAAELVEALVETRGFDISVAAYPETHPQAQSSLADLRHLRRKLDAGAERAITQYFFDADCFLRFRDRAVALGIDKPIVPGVLPVHDIDKVIAFSKRCGATVPAEYAARFAPVAHNPEAGYRLALELAVGLCQRLVDEGVEHIHLYTLNQTDMCLDLSLALGASIDTTRICPAA